MSVHRGAPSGRPGFAALVLVAGLATSTLAGCSSSEPRETTTVHCMKCHRVVSAEAVVCTDCAAPRANPTVAEESYEPTTAPEPSQPAPAAQPAPPVANRSVKRQIFLNKFAPADSDAVEAELLSLAGFTDVTPGGGDPGRRVVIECRYSGTNMKRELVGVMRKLGYRFHFTEAKLPEQVELIRD